MISKITNVRLYAGIAIAIFALGYISISSAYAEQYQTTGHIRLPDYQGKPFTPYFHYDNGGSITIASDHGTFVYDKNSCGIKVYTPTQNPSVSNLVINHVGLTLQYADDLNGTWTKSSLNNIPCIVTQSENSDQYQITSQRNNSDGIWIIQYVLSYDKPFEYTSTFVNTGNTHYYIVTETQDGIPSHLKIKGQNQLHDPTISKNIGKPIFNNDARNVGKISYNDNFSYSYDTANKKLYTVQYNIHNDKTKQIINNFYSGKPLSKGQSFSFDPTFDIATGSGDVVNFDLSGIARGSTITSASMTFTINNSTGTICTLRLIDPALTETSVSDTFPCVGTHNMQFNQVGKYALENNVLHPVTIGISVKDENENINTITSSSIQVNYQSPTYFAQVVDNKVIDVIVADQSFVNTLNGTWIETKIDGSIRGNFAGIGDTYNSTRDQFIPFQPYHSWILNSTGQWNAPIPYPSDGQFHTWNETIENWN